MENDYVKELMNVGIPVILVDRKVHGVNTDIIVSDNYGGVYMLTKFLIDKGHKDICIINGILNVSTGQERFEGFRAAMNEYDIPIKQEFILNGNYTEERAYEAVKK